MTKRPTSALGISLSMMDNLPSPEGATEVIENGSLPSRIDISIRITQHGLCPVTMVLSYKTQRGPGAGPLFCYRDRRLLTRGQFVVEVKRVLTRAGIRNTHYSL